MGKLNQWKVQKTESMENLYLWFSKCGKVTMHKCFKHWHFGGGLVIWTISVRLIFTKWQPVFNLIIMTDTDILLPLTFILGHLYVMTFLHSENQRCEFSIYSVFPITHPRFHFNIYAWTFMHSDLSALRIWRCEFSVDSVLGNLHWFGYPLHHT